MAGQFSVPKGLAPLSVVIYGATISPVAPHVVKSEIGVLGGYLIQYSCFPLASIGNVRCDIRAP